MKIKDLPELCGVDCPLFDGRICMTEYSPPCIMLDGETELSEAVKAADKLEADRHD
jgi:hypothetical protein